MSKWFDITIPRKYLGRMTEKGYYIQLPGGNWYIISSTKLVRVNENSDVFTLATRNEFVYNAVEKVKDKNGVIQQTNKGYLTGEDVAKAFKNI